MTTYFQKTVWGALKKIPRGRVTTYGAIARYLDTKAVRAIGTAVGKNPGAPEVPCHRVVLFNGSVGNYSGIGGDNTKIELLKQEGIDIEKGKIKYFDEVFFDFKE